MEQKSRNYLSRASLLLGAFSQHMFGYALAGARAIARSRAPSRIAPALHNPAGSKPAGTRGMHGGGGIGFRPMAHGKLGKRSKPVNGSQKRARNRQMAAALLAKRAAFLRDERDAYTAAG